MFHNELIHHQREFWSQRSRQLAQILAGQSVVSLAEVIAQQQAFIKAINKETGQVAHRYHSDTHVVSPPVGGTHLLTFGRLLNPEDDPVTTRRME